jgi:hypothetical protein
MATPEKREAIMKRLREAFPQALASIRSPSTSVEELISTMLAVPVQGTPSV